MTNNPTLSVAMYGVYGLEFFDDNGGYHHITEGKTGVICKNGVTICLTEEEIRKVVETFGGNFRR
jgi:hypothetical protein